MTSPQEERRGGRGAAFGGPSPPELVVASVPLTDAMAAAVDDPREYMGHLRRLQALWGSEAPEGLRRSLAVAASLCTALQSGDARLDALIEIAEHFDALRAVAPRPKLAPVSSAGGSSLAPTLGSPAAARVGIRQLFKTAAMGGAGESPSPTDSPAALRQRQRAAAAAAASQQLFLETRRHEEQLRRRNEAVRRQQVLDWFAADGPAQAVTQTYGSASEAAAAADGSVLSESEEVKVSLCPSCIPDVPCRAHFFKRFEPLTDAMASAVDDKLHLTQYVNALSCLAIYSEMMGSTKLSQACAFVRHSVLRSPEPDSNLLIDGIVRVSSELDLMAADPNQRRLLARLNQGAGRAA